MDKKISIKMNILKPDGYITQCSSFPYLVMLATDPVHLQLRVDPDTSPRTKKMTQEKIWLPKNLRIALNYLKNILIVLF